MPQKTPNLEQRLTRAEKELANLQSLLARAPAEPWYRQIVGSFAKDPAYAEIVCLGRLIRRGKLKG